MTEPDDTDPAPPEHAAKVAPALPASPSSSSVARGEPHSAGDRSAAEAARRAERTAAAAECTIAAAIDPGARAMVVAVAVLVLFFSFTLPHTGTANGWEVLVSADDARAEAVALPSRVFLTLAVAFGAVMSMLALITRRWALAWIALAGCALASVFGMLAVWSRQTVSPNLAVAGVGPGLLVGWATVIVLTFHWLKVVWGRTVAQTDAEHERRRRAADAERYREVNTGPGGFMPRLK
ncbi:Rv2732c family membrane protein [Rhodococcus koreensis]